MFNMATMFRPFDHVVGAVCVWRRADKLIAFILGGIMRCGVRYENCGGLGQFRKYRRCVFGNVPAL